MMNRFPLWKNLLILATLLIGCVYALPNLYGEDPSVQLSPLRNAKIDDALLNQVEKTLKDKGSVYKSVESDAKRALVRFGSPEDQLKAAEFLNQVLGQNYTVALNLAPAIPSWLNMLGAKPMYLGLDLRGGVHFLMQVDMQAAERQTEERYVEDIRNTLRDKKIHATVNREDNGSIRIEFETVETQANAKALLKKELRNLQLDDGAANTLVAKISEMDRRETRKFAVEQNITTLRNRVNELGVAEPVIQQQGTDQIVVQLPGVQDTARAKEILGATATLEFRLVDTEHDISGAIQGKVPVGTRLYKDRNGAPVLLKRQILVTGDQVIDASSGVDQQQGAAAVFVTLNGAAANKMAKTTRENIGKPMAVVYIENKMETREVEGQKVKQRKTVEEVINVATIRDQFSKRFQITGLDSPQEARNLALLLRAGALAAPMDIIEERTIGPSLGKDNIQQGAFSAMVGFGLVVVFMSIYYRLFGIIASVAVTLNVVLIIAILSMLQATLTLPGIAGIALTVGMAVDANVLINERIREEMRNGSSPQAAIYAGYERAFATIFDSNSTHLLAALALFLVGSGAIKGFAVTWSIGTLMSMFTGVMVTRMFVNWIYGNRRVQKLSV